MEYCFYASCVNNEWDEPYCTMIGVSPEYGCPNSRNVNELHQCIKVNERAHKSRITIVKELLIAISMNDFTDKEVNEFISSLDDVPFRDSFEREYLKLKGLPNGI